MFGVSMFILFFSSFSVVPLTELFATTVVLLDVDDVVVVDDVEPQFATCIVFLVVWFSSVV